MTTAFGTTLVAIRQRSNPFISQKRLARRTGLSPSYISRLENGERDPSRDTVERCIDALDLGGEERRKLYAAAGFLDTREIPTVGLSQPLDDYDLREIRLSHFDADYAVPTCVHCGDTFPCTVIRLLDALEYERGVVKAAVNAVGVARYVDMGDHVDVHTDDWDRIVRALVELAER